MSLFTAYHVNDGTDQFEYEGCRYETSLELIQCGILEFCACGMPEENLRYILRGLELIAEQPPKEYEESKDQFFAWWKAHDAREMEHYKTEAGKFFFYYWADKEDYVEHGGVVPGWLTEKGQCLLDLLREYSVTIGFDD